MRILFRFVLVLGLVTIIGCSKSTDPVTISGGSTGGYVLTEWHIETRLPNYVNIMFQVTDMAGAGVPSLGTSNFNIFEDGNAVSPTESFPLIRPRHEIPYELKTVLLLDNSTSVGANLNEIKAAAKQLVASVTDQQEFAVYVFSENLVLVQDFTSNVSALTAAIDSIQLGYATTDLYGAVMGGVVTWDDRYTLDSIKQGFMVILTDGSDTQHSHTIEQALAARGNKRVYTIGLGNEIEPDKLEQIGNAGFYPIANADGVASTFSDIQHAMIAFANSFYWLYYQSPTRGNNYHTLGLTVRNNSNTGTNSYISDTFSSSGFYSLPQGLYVVMDTSDAQAVDTLYLMADEPVKLRAVSVGYSASPVYTWTTNSDSIVIEMDANEYANCTVTIAGATGTNATVSVSDAANSTTETVPVVEMMPQLKWAGSCNTLGTAWDVFIQGNYAYVADVSAGLAIIDIAQPDAPTLVDTCDVPGFVRDVSVQGDYAYCADGDYGLWVIDITQSSAPTAVGFYYTSGYAWGVFVQSTYAYIADDDAGLRVVRITQPSAPALTGSYNTPGHARGVFVQGNYAYVADGDGGLMVIDVSQPSTPTLVGSCNTSGYARGVFVQGNYAYVADGADGLQVIDISQSYAPAVVGSYDTPGNSYGVFVRNDLAFIADGSAGLYMIDVTQPNSPSLVDSYDTPGTAQGVFTRGVYAYVADGSSLQIIRTAVPVR